MADVPMLVSVALPKESDPALGDHGTPLWIRPGTPDEDVVREVWQDDVYHLRGLQLADREARRIRDGLGRIRELHRIGPRIIDLGACTGVFSALAARMFPGAIIEAFEPNAENFTLLCANGAADADGTGTVIQVNQAVGGRLGEVKMIGEGATGHTAWARDGEFTVMQTTLESIIAGEQVALLKIDVEGAEYEILDAVPVEQLALVDRIHMEWHGPEMCPWLPNSTNVWYGDMLHKLAFTHAVNVFGNPNRGGMLFAHRYDL